MSADPGEDVDERDAASLERLLSGTAQVLPEGGLAAKLALARAESRPLRVKFGIDPSGADLTLGHAVALRKLRQFQDAGHLAVLIIGDFTGQVGDPSGKTATRAARTADETEANSTTYFDQVLRILDPDRIEVRRNSEWLGAMTMTDVLREARELTVARLLERDDFAQRFAGHQPISLVEFLYPLLQGYDSVAVAADIEIGGTDQTYNLLVGRDLQRAHDQRPQAVVTVPLLEGLDGVEKMGKSLNNFVAIAEPPPEQFGKLMSLPDSMIGRYLRLCTDLHPGEIAQIEEAAAAGGPAAGQAKRRLAREVVTLYHGADAAGAAEAHFDRVVRDRGTADDVPEAQLGPGDPVHLPAALRAAGLAASTSEARRLIDTGAVRVDGVPLGEYDVARELVSGRVVQCGKRRQVRFVEPSTST
ncbi:MAG TPA: tyrosine--tRNA ligase [Mycobacteriales bacterium]|nr:tyrosine--tRNA ligase [Mycobacteriales bacterium]